MALPEEAEFYRARAATCRTLAAKAGDRVRRQELTDHARFYEALAEAALAIRPTVLDIAADSAFLPPARARRQERRSRMMKSPATFRPPGSS